VGLFAWLAGLFNSPAAARELTGVAPAAQTPPPDAALAMAERLVRQCEGCVLKPYLDLGGKGVWTIGIGSIRLADGSPVTALTPPITQAQADALMMGELAPTLDKVRALVASPLTDRQAAALASFAYNEGLHAFETSTLLKKLNAGDLYGASAEFPKWVYAGGKVVVGLQTRRALERALFDGTADI
jgi:lysozyme